ncbi:MAG: amidohydrolase family protein, partial [bacterium]
MKEVKRHRKLDAHAHVGFDPGDEETQIEFADRLGIEKLCISRPITNFSGTEPEGPEQVRECNDLIL